MSRGKTALVSSVAVAILSFILMRVMYVIDLVTFDTGFLTTMVFIFVNVPMWIMSGLIFAYGIFIMIKDKKNDFYSIKEEVEDVTDIESEDDIQEKR